MRNHHQKPSYAATIGACLCLFAAGWQGVANAEPNAPGCAPVCVSKECFVDPNEKGLAGVKLGMTSEEAEAGLARYLGVPSRKIHNAHDHPNVLLHKANYAKTGSKYPLTAWLTYEDLNQMKSHNVTLYNRVKTEPPVVEKVTRLIIRYENLAQLVKEETLMVKQGAGDEQRVKDYAVATEAHKGLVYEQQKAAFEKEILETYGCPTVSKYGVWEWCLKLTNNKTACAMDQAELNYHSGGLTLRQNPK
jgi:hypothetical protein